MDSRRAVRIVAVVVVMLGLSSSAALAQTVDPVPDRTKFPTAVDDAAMTDEDTAVVIDVLANDTDPDGDALRVAAIYLPAIGSADLLHPTEAIIYTPAANYSGSVTFGYLACDPSGHCDNATVHVTIAEVDDPTTVSLTPKTATTVVFERHCVTATVTGQTGAPLEGVRVDWDVQGPGLGGVDFTRAGGRAQFCYSLAEPGVDTITVRVGTLSDTATNTWVLSKPVDHDAPTCIVPSTTGTDAAGKLYTEAIVQDTGSGLASVEAVTLYNSTMTVAPFTAGTTDPVTVRFTRVMQAEASGWEFRVTDTLGNSQVCDPVMTLVIRDGEGSDRQTFTGLPEAEHNVVIDNQDPGLKAIKLIVNGVKFKERKLQPGERRSFSVASAMRPGRDNTIEIIGRGKKGASAIVVIAD